MQIWGDTLCQCQKKAPPNKTKTLKQRNTGGTNDGHGNNPLPLVTEETVEGAVAALVNRESAGARGPGAAQALEYLEGYLSIGKRFSGIQELVNTMLEEERQQAKQKAQA